MIGLSKTYIPFRLLAPIFYRISAFLSPPIPPELRGKIEIIIKNAGKKAGQSAKEDLKMKKLFVWMLMLLCATGLGGCQSKTTLSPAAPVTLTMWHVYGEQADSPMNRLIAQFNETVGREKGGWTVSGVFQARRSANMGGMSAQRRGEVVQSSSAKIAWSRSSQLWAEQRANSSSASPSSSSYSCTERPSISCFSGNGP